MTLSNETTNRKRTNHMKTVFAQAQCVHVWAQQSQPKGRAAENRIFFEDETIYSYGYHFPMATFYKPDLVVINSSSYSSSTSGHQSAVRQSIRGDVKKVYAPTEVIKALLWDKGSETSLKQAGNAFANYALREAQNFIYSAAKRAKAFNRVRDLRDAHTALAAVKEFYEALEINQPIPEAVTFLLKEVLDNSDKLIAERGAEIKTARAAELKRKKEREAEEAERFKFASEMWRNGENVPYPYSGALNTSKTILMRLKNEETIETSKGAEFPVSHAIKVFKYIRTRKELAIAYDSQHDTLNGNHVIRLGHFQIDAIEENGNVKAGCHYVEWAEIERMARILKVYP